MSRKSAPASPRVRATIAEYGLGRCARATCRNGVGASLSVSTL